MIPSLSTQIAVTFSMVFYSIIGPERVIRAWGWVRSLF